MKPLFILAMLCPLLSPGQPKPLSVGDTLPDMELTNIINYTSPAAKLSDFKNKLLILDFWATWCTPCLHGLPKLDSLQQQFGSRLQVLLVNSKSTGDDSKRMTAFFNKQAKQYALPSLTADTILSKLFPHRLLPHYVWIHKGKVTAITAAAGVSAANISRVLSGQPVAFKLKKDVTGAEEEKQLLADDNVVYRSVLRKGIDGLPSAAGIKKNKSGLVCRLYFINVPLARLYQAAYGVQGEKILFSANAAAGSYCYELIVPPCPPDSAYRFMQQDLLRFFPYKIEWTAEQKLVIANR